jgi:hypothetical protein
MTGDATPTVPQVLCCPQRSGGAAERKLIPGKVHVGAVPKSKIVAYSQAGTSTAPCSWLVPPEVADSGWHPQPKIQME